MRGWKKCCEKVNGLGSATWNSPGVSASEVFKAKTVFEMV